MARMKALVTGGAGFIGSHVVDELIDRGWEVIILDDLSIGETENINDKATFINGDIRNADIVKMAMDGVDVVFHFAYDATESKSIFSPVLDADINILGSLMVLKEAINAGVEKFVFPSSVLVYGIPEYVPIDEKHPLNPNDPYSITKVAFERYLEIYYELGQIKPYIIRFTNTYGPRLRLDNPYKGAVQIFISRCFKNKPPLIFGDGQHKRAWTYVEDIKKPIVDVIEYDELINSPINIGSDFVYTVEKIAKLVSQQIKNDEKVGYLPEREKDIKLAYCDVTKMQIVLNHKCTTDIEEGIKKTIEWGKTQDIDFKYNWVVEIPSLLDDKYKKKQL